MPENGNISLPFFCTSTTLNFQKLLSYTFWGGNVVRVLVHFFFTPAHFHLAFVAASISHFVTTAISLFVCFFLISRSRSCRHVFSLSFAGLPPIFLYLCLCLALYSKFVEMTINLRQPGYRDNFRFPFSSFLVVSALQKAGCYAISCRNNRVAFGLPYLLIELFYIGMPVVRTDGQCTIT